MKNFNRKAHYPFTYGDKYADDIRLSDYFVSAAKNKRVQKHISSIAAALFTLVMYIQPASAIPAEYGEAVNGILDQATQNGAAAGGVPAVPPLGIIQGQIPVSQGNQQYVLPSMPIEQQRLIAAQQAGQIAGMAGMPKGAPTGQTSPTNPPAFYIPEKPKAVIPRAVNTIAFTTALGIICLNAAWGEPVAMLMCSSGLVGIAYKLGKEVVVFMAKHIN